MSEFEQVSIDDVDLANRALDAWQRAKADMLPDFDK